MSTPKRTFSPMQSPAIKQRVSKMQSLDIDSPAAADLTKVRYALIYFGVYALLNGMKFNHVYQTIDKPFCICCFIEKTTVVVLFFAFCVLSVTKFSNLITALDSSNRFHLSSFFLFPLIMCVEIRDSRVLRIGNRLCRRR